MEEKNQLFVRVEEENTETPRACHTIALYLASQGKAIPADVQDAVLASAERGRDVLVDCLVDVNRASLGDAVEYSLRERYLRLAAQIAFSYGVDGPDACQRRLDHMLSAMNRFESEDTEGVGFTE
ncbi:MAG TPA: hypothetical protein VJ227_01415 [Patescibacteria group bacterium]|nr:hypothetical protein [Patescibacteria group bacterium]